MITRTEQLVTIGIPLYNEEKYIEDALRSAAPQCGTVWVSDNSSTDGSAAICERVSREYPNIHFVRQHHNMGSVANFKFVLDKADTPFFMWLGSHDVLPDGYVRELTQLFEDCPEAILAYGASRHVDLNGKPAGNYDYFYSTMLADKSPATRIIGLIRHLSDCSLVHGVFRTDALRSAWVAWEAMGIGAYIGSDHVLLAQAAIIGPFLYAPETYVIRLKAHPADTPQEQVNRMDSRQPSVEQLSFREMQRRQYSLVVSVTRSAGLFGLLFRLNARFFMVKRFGSFGKTFLLRKLDTFLFLLASPLSDLPRNLFNMMRYGFAYRVQKLKFMLSDCWKAK